MSDSIEFAPGGFTGRKAEWLVSAFVAVLTFFAVRFAYIAQKMEAMLSEFGSAQIYPGLVFIAHHLIVVLGLILLLTAVTLWFVWSRARISTVIAVAGILCLGGTVYYLGFVSFVPFFEVIRTMGEQ